MLFKRIDMLVLRLTFHCVLRGHGVRPLKNSRNCECSHAREWNASRWTRALHFSFIQLRQPRCRDAHLAQPPLCPVARAAAPGRPRTVEPMRHSKPDKRIEVRRHFVPCQVQYWTSYYTRSIVIVRTSQVRDVLSDHGPTQQLPYHRHLLADASLVPASLGPPLPLLSGHCILLEQVARQRPNWQRCFPRHLHRAK